MTQHVERYQVKMYNHKGDFLALLGIVLTAVLMAFVNRVYHIGQLGSGPPVVNFPRIYPKDVYSYYDVENLNIP